MNNPREDDVVMIFAIERYSYRPRQRALIHVEQVFDENVLTLRGEIAPVEYKISRHRKAAAASRKWPKSARITAKGCNTLFSSAR